MTTLHRQSQRSCLSDEIISLWVYPHQIKLFPPTNWCASEIWNCQASLLIKIRTLFANCFCPAAMALVRSKESNAAMKVLCSNSNLQKRRPIGRLLPCCWKAGWDNSAHILQWYYLFWIRIVADLGMGKDLSTRSSSNSTSRVVARIDDPLPACNISR